MVGAVPPSKDDSLPEQKVHACFDPRFGIPSENTIDYYRKQVERLANDQTESGKYWYKIQSDTLVKLEEMVRNHKTQSDSLTNIEEMFHQRKAFK